MIGLHHLIWIHLLKHSNHTLISKQVLAKHLSKHVAHTFLQTSSHFSLKNGRKKKIDPMSKTKATLLLCPWVLPGSVESVGIFFFHSIFCLVFVNEKYYHFRSGGKKERMPPFPIQFSIKRTGVMDVQVQIPQGFLWISSFTFLLEFNWCKLHRRVDSIMSIL